MQTYTAAQLDEILAAAGFRVLERLDIHGERFDEQCSERILTVAQKLPA